MLRIHVHFPLGILCALLMVTPATAGDPSASWKESFEAGVAARRAAKYADAERLVRVAVAQAEALGQHDDRLVMSLNELGLILRRANKLDAAQTMHRRALSVAEAAHGSNGPDAASGFYGLAVVASVQGNTDDAEQLFRRALTIREKSLGDNDPSVGRYLYGYATFKMGQQDFGQARSMLTRALGILERDPGDEPEFRALTLVSLGIIYEQQNNVSEASRAFERALREGEQVLPATHPTLAWIRAEAAEFKFGMNDTLASVALFEKAIPILASAEGANEQQVAAYKADLAAEYVALRRWEDAERTYSESLPVLQKSMSKDDPTLKNALAQHDELKRFIASRSIATPQYETRYVGGTMVFVGRSGALEVRLSAQKSDDLAVILYVVNNSDQPVTFFPEQVKVEAIHRKRELVTREPVRMFSADEYASRVNTSLAWKSLFAAMGNYQAPQPETYTTSTKTNAQAYDWTSGTTVTERSSTSGTITKQPNEADRQATQARAQARTENMMAPARARTQEIAAGLMRTHTLDPHTSYGGTVYAKTKGTEYVATVPFGGTNFEFSFQFGR